MKFYFALVLIFISSPAWSQMTISVMGDILIHEALYIEAEKSPEQFYSLFKLVTPLLSQADFSYGNLEGCIAPGVLADGTATKDPGFVYDKKVYSGTNFSFNYHPYLVTDLKKLGVDLVSTANNHALDRGSLGVDRTIVNLQKAGMLFNGTQHAGEDFDFTWTEIKGFKVGWLSCTEMTNGIPDPHHQVLRCYKDQSLIDNLIKKHKGEILILTPHWGQEYMGTPNSEQKNWAHHMAEMGVTAIVGNHPHVLQPLEWISTSDHRKVFVAYSLGNFIAGQQGVEKKASVILYLEFDHSGVLQSTYYRPTWRGGNWVAPYEPKFGPEPLEYIKSVLGPSYK